MDPDPNQNSSARPTTAKELLSQLMIAHDKKKYPSLPNNARSIPKMSDATANGLTKMILTHLNLSGHFAERINTMGVYRNGESITDVIGFTRTFKGKYTKGGGTKGSADISAIVGGKAIKVEVKVGKDKMSEHQIAYKHKVEAAGAIYLVAKTFEQYYEEYLKLIK